MAKYAEPSVNPSAIVMEALQASQTQPSRTQSLRHMQRLIADYPELTKRIEVDGEYAVGTLEHARFTSSFSEIFEIELDDIGIPSDADNPLTPAWHDALTRKTRGWHGNSVAFDSVAVLVSSAALFPTAKQSSLFVELDRLTRTLHVMNFAVSGLPGKLFVPVHERLLTHVRHDHGQYFSTVLLSLGMLPEHVVIEIPAAFAAQPRRLAFIAANYRRYGFKVALQLPSEATLTAAVPLTLFDYLVPDLDEDAPLSCLGPLVQQAHDYGVRLVLNSPVSVASGVQRVIAGRVQTAPTR